VNVQPSKDQGKTDEEWHTMLIILATCMVYAGMFSAPDPAWELVKIEGLPSYEQPSRSDPSWNGPSCTWPECISLRPADTPKASMKVYMKRLMKPGEVVKLPGDCQLELQEETAPR
jgi:hypothetical protein